MLQATSDSGVVGYSSVISVTSPPSNVKSKIKSLLAKLESLAPGGIAGIAVGCFVVI